MTYCRKKLKLLASLAALLLFLTPLAVYAAEDLVLERVYEAALYIPRIWFVLKRQPGGPVLKYNGQFRQNYAFLDTGASGVLLSLETALMFDLYYDPNANFVDVGIGGDEHFYVSEPLYLGLAGFNNPRASDPNAYQIRGPARFQIKKTKAGLLSEPIDVIGMPAIAGQIVVLNSGSTNDLGYFTAEIKNHGDRDIPNVDFQIAIRLQNFLNPNNPKNILPLPVASYNPVIENISVQNKGRISKGNWLFDTGATISLISTEQAQLLGLMDKKGDPLTEPDFMLPVGGVGKIVLIPGFQVDSLTVPTLSGFNLVYKNARIGVKDIKFFAEEKGEFVVLDGVFGSNLLCASAKMDGLLTSKTIFNKIVLDLQKATVGFDIYDSYAQPNK
ncbi:MAG: pepsin/retropepsin-like aspartic protease family protein [Planctomycetota bacterium]